MDRRTFLGWVGVGWVASSLPVALAACSSGNSDTQAQTNNTATDTLVASSPRSDRFVVVGTVADLTQKGQILNKQSAVGPVLVVRNPAASNQLVAVNPTCPHLRCTVDWKSQPREFVCPCHGSKFATNGTVVTGPADKPLKTYQAKIEGNSVLVRSS
jgi:cytochrome b6-f complex iron-sulfur subunit